MNATDYRLLAKIADRAQEMDDRLTDRLSLMMDIESAHEDVGLDLQKFLDFDDENFAHDLYGIVSHMDRTTYPGKLTDCFLPRCAA
jgi:hypothetical protein